MRLMDRVQLADLADRYWEAWLRAHPVMATAFGDRRHDAELDRIDPAGVAARRVELDGFSAEAAALPDTELDDGDRVTAAALREAIAADLAFLVAEPQVYTVDPLDGPQVEFLNIPDVQAVRTPDEGRAMVARWRAMGPWIDDLIAANERGIAEARVGVATHVRRVLAQLDELVARPNDAWPLLSPATTAGAEWPQSEREAFGAALAAAVAETVRPAFERYREFLVSRLAPMARRDDRPGLVHIDGGAETYRALARAHTSVEASPEELHDIGVREVARIDREFVELGGKLLGTSDLPSTLARLRDDPALRFATRDEVFAVAQRSLDRAREAIPDWFGRLPAATCEVLPMAPHEEEHSTIAYYREPAADGSRPGQFHINTSAPETRPRYEAEALAFHESIPGHHLQIAIAQELDDLPAFRRLWGSTAFIEGWGLYTERLADDMGLYSGDLDRFGVLSFDAWRACRLVVDTGMHAMGWPRDRAIAFMTDHTALGANNIANEVDRYIASPGQALAYKVGQLELFRLRDEARRRQGAAFDIRRFHDTVLGQGAPPLAVLREVVERELDGQDRQA